MSGWGEHDKNVERGVCGERERERRGTESSREDGQEKLGVKTVKTVQRANAT